jgi:hypothetical protein
MLIRSYTLVQSIVIASVKERVWQEITQVDIVTAKHPALLRLFGIPKPLRAEMRVVGEGGERIAFFANGLRFVQRISTWLPGQRYAFRFQPDPGFRVAYCFDLSKGPFQIVSGSYELQEHPNGIELLLASHYTLRGVIGNLIALPVWLLMRIYQNFLLQSIRANCEQNALA